MLIDEGSSKRKKVVVSYPDDGEDELHRIAKEMGLQPDDEPEIIASKWIINLLATYDLLAALHTDCASETLPSPNQPHRGGGGVK